MNSHHLHASPTHIWNYPVSTLYYTITFTFWTSKFLSNTCLQMTARWVVCTESCNTSVSSTWQSFNAHSCTFIFIWRFYISAFICNHWINRNPAGKCFLSQWSIYLKISLHAFCEYVWQCCCKDAKPHLPANNVHNKKTS